ncbi:FAD-dependent oxidoreductase [Myroides odoratus]|uniref:FAD-dependent oxidoreductase n=1 Tax=Myroides odoratus TaxID=256 RepID=UPI000765B185|nr:NAD(P)/FAD-dependent oxidoreductase [Myroides odoratus]
MGKSIAIVGSGLVGTVLAIALKQEGHQVFVYEKGDDIRTIDFSGRSINLALSERGWKMLKRVGLEEKVRQFGIPMHQRAIHHVNREEHQPYGIHGEAIWAVSRGGLNKKLVEWAEEVGVQFVFNTPIWSVDTKRGVLYTSAAEYQEWKEIQHDVIFGADGAYSKVRSCLQRRSRFEYQQSYLPIAYKELVIPAKAEGVFAMDEHSFHIWPRKDFMLIALPNMDGSFTCTLFMPYQGEVSFERIKTPEQVTAFFETYFPDALQLMPDLVELYTENPVNSLVTTTCFPWVYKDKVALIGDAAHAVVPFYGQGLNAGLEDVDVLLDCLQQQAGNWLEALDQYQYSRKVNADAIAELSYRNFREMSELTANPLFLLRKKIESKFAKKYPDLWLPLYDRVTFSQGSYQEALAIGDKQAAIMDVIMETEQIETVWDSLEIEEKLKQLINENRGF